MKKLLTFLSLILITTATQAFACDSIKWCQQTPNSTNGWSSASYQCGCNDAPKYDNNPNLGQRTITQTTTVNDDNRGAKTIAK